ncbi:MAG: hypothetical protein WED10_15325 [Brumimicrobium sp.]
MEELVPVTISNSILGAPTVLLTNKGETYLLHRPINDHIRVTNEVLSFTFNHFKINRLKVGVFTLKGKKYFCNQEINGVEELNYWHEFLWDSKRKFNQFLSPKTLFYSYLIDLFFPLFNNTKKLIVPGRKNYFAVHAVPENNFELLKFNPSSPAKLGLTKGGIKSFFKHVGTDLLEYLDEFESLYHEKFKSDLKYRISLYPALRNQYWDELQLCFDTEFIQYTRAEVKNYILKL